MNGKTLSPLLWLTLAIAAGAQAVPVNFKGGFVETLPCTINNGGVIELDFNSVIIRNIDGQRYSQAVMYAIDCPASGAVRLTLKGTHTAFDDAAVVTDIAGLGIRINQNGQPFTLNLPITVDPASPPELVAVPVAEPGQTLNTGVFQATATLMAEYQ